MAQSKCAACGSHVFENVIYEPQKSNFKVTFVQCAKCGAVVGVMDFFNLGALLNKIEKKLG